MNKLKQIAVMNGKGVYFPEAGEKLSDVASKFSTTERLIALDNNLSSGEISGRALYVESHGKSYIVKPTDTIENIAEKSGFLPETILKMNCITYIYPGQKIILK